MYDKHHRENYDRLIEIYGPQLIQHPVHLELTLGASQCIYCGKDAETCEHNDDLDWSQYADKESDAERNQ